MPDILLSSENSNSKEPASGAGDVFATTHWTIVIAAGQRHTPESDFALEELCRTYWFPLYAYARRRGYRKEDAEDLAQAFFARLLAKNDLAGLTAERGKFRAFLPAALKNFLANEWDKSRRLKRGGGQAALSLDWETADTRFRMQVAGGGPGPEWVFDREWALALLTRVIERLRAELTMEGKAELLDRLKVFLGAGKESHEGMAQRDAAEALGMDEGAVRVAVHRLRKRYRRVLRDEIASTLSDPSMVDEEIRALFRVFGE